MKFLALGIIVILCFFVGIYFITQQAPTPNAAAIQFALDRYIDFTPMKWDYEFGKESTTTNGTPAKPVIYHITTTEGRKQKEVELTLLFYKVDKEWKTEKLN